MQHLVGLIRTESELLQALEDLDKLDERAQNVSVDGTPSYNPGWNLATDLPAMLTVSRLVAKAAIERRESRGGQTRDDYPKTDPELGKVNFIQRLRPDGTFELEKVPISPVPAELAALLEEETK
jgi:succinate dehydrogenase / fumarate reductase flavoprotein subunit